MLVIFHFDGFHIFVESNVPSIRIMLEGVADFFLKRHARIYNKKFTELKSNLK